MPEQEGSYGSWPEFDTSGLASDITLEAEYTPWVTVVASLQQEGKLALAMADGQFTQDAVLTVRESAETPPEAARSGDTVRVWEISLTGTDLTEQDTVPLRLLSGGSRASVWQYKDGAWHKVDADRNGHYLLLDMEGTSGTFCVSSRQGSPALLLAVILAAVVLLLAALFLLRSRRKKDAAAKRETSAPPAEEPAPK